MKIRKLIGKLHLWLGIPSGLLVFIIAITGCMYSFQEEIQNATQPFRFVQIEDKAFLPPSKLTPIAQQLLPGKVLHSIKYNNRDKAVEAIFYHYEPTYYYTIYINPYNGKILKMVDNNAGFFRFILNGHFYLWLPPNIGQPVVATSTLVFLLVLISGIVLWIPQNRKAIKPALTFDWKKTTKWKRKNLDLHNVPGFYAALVAIAIASTGLVWGFQWFANGVYKATGGQKELMYSEPISQTQKNNTTHGSTTVIDDLWEKMVKEYAMANSIEIHPPANDSSVIAVNANLSSGTYWKTDYRYFDRYSLKEISVNHIYGRIAEAKFSDKLIRMNYDIHVGAIGGLPGKTVVFFVGLIIASLPITGFYIWWNRRKRRTKA